MTDLVAYVILLCSLIGLSNKLHVIVPRCLDCFTKGMQCPGSLMEQVCAQDEDSCLPSKLVVREESFSIAIEGRYFSSVID